MDRLAAREAVLFPVTQAMVLGMTDGRYFHEVMELVTEAVFYHSGVYRFPVESRLPVEYTLLFLGEADNPIGRFRVEVGAGRPDVPLIVKYIDGFSCRAVSATNPWYDAALAGKFGPEVPGGL